MSGENVIMIGEKFNKSSKNFEVVKREHEKISHLDNYARSKGIKLFFDSENYFILDNNFSLVEDFVFKKRKKNVGQKRYYSVSSEQSITDFYFDFFFNLEVSDENVPVFVRSNNFLEDRFNLGYTKIIEDGYMEFKEFQNLNYKKESVMHPELIENILLLHTGLGVGKDVINKLESDLIQIRKDNPAFVGENMKYAQRHINIGDRCGWTSCGNCMSKLSEDYEDNCESCGSYLEGSSTHYI